MSFTTHFEQGIPHSDKVLSEVFAYLGIQTLYGTIDVAKVCIDKRTTDSVERPFGDWETDPKVSVKIFKALLKHWLESEDSDDEVGVLRV